MKRKLSKRLTTLITVLALLLLILPAGVLFADSIKNDDKQTAKPSETLLQAGDPEETDEEDPDEEGPDEEEPDEEEGEDEGVKSEQALLVEQRIADAKALGIPPGKLNLVDKLIAAMLENGTEITREDLLASLGKASWSDVPVQDIMKALKENRKPEITEPSETDETAALTGTEPEVKNNGKAKGKNKQ